MKLTRSQYIFVAIGKLDARISRDIDAMKDFPPEANATQEFHLNQLRSLRKQLLRNALAAARSENAKHFIAGVKFAILNS